MKAINRFPGLTKESMPLLMYSLQDSAVVEDSVLGACQILSSKSLIRHMLQVTCLPKCNVYKIGGVGQSIKCFDLLFVNLFIMMFSLDVSLLVWCGLSKVLTFFLFLQDWNDLVAFLTTILNRFVSSPISRLNVLVLN